MAARASPARLRHAADEKARWRSSGTDSWYRDGLDLADGWAQLRQVAAYVRSFGRTEAVPLPGDPLKGKVLYAKGDCAKCHAVRDREAASAPTCPTIALAVVRPTSARPFTTPVPPSRSMRTISPSSNLLYWGTGNPGPDWNGDVRPGDNLYTCVCWRSMPRPAS